MLRLVLILVFIILAFFYASDDLKYKYEKRRKHYILIVTLLLILQSELRNMGVGADTYKYYSFEIVRETQWKNIFNAFINFKDKDPFYSLFQKIFQLFSGNYQIYLITVAVIFMTSFGYFIFDNTSRIRHALLAFILYMGNFYGFFSITGIRQPWQPPFFFGVSNT